MQVSIFTHLFFTSVKDSIYNLISNNDFFLLIGLVLMTTSFYGQTTKTNKTMEKSAMEVFQAFGQGMMSGTDLWKEYIADNIKFIGPVDRVNGKNPIN